MAFKINWYSETQAIYLEMSGVITPAEVMQINSATIKLSQQHTDPVNIIIDTLEVTEIPHNLRWVLEMMRTNPAAPKGWNIVIQRNLAIQLMASTILRILKVPFYFCATCDEATSFLDSHTPQAPAY